MKIRLLTVVVAMFFADSLLAAQPDTLLLKNGDRILCYIDGHDTDNVNIIINHNGRSIKTFYPLSDVEAIRYYQSVPTDFGADHISLGIGIGNDFSGIIGAQLLVYPQKNIGLFVSGGLSLAGASYNMGVKLRYINNTKIHPYLIGSYGYTYSITTTDEDGKIVKSDSKIFIGSMLGAGIDFHPSHSIKSYLSVSLFYKFNYSEANDYIDELKLKGYEFDTKCFPVGLSVGYRFVFK